MRKRKEMGWVSHVMPGIENRWTTKVTEWQPRNWRRQERQRTRWRDEVRAFAGAILSTRASLRERWRMLGRLLSCSELVMTDDENYWEEEETRVQWD